MWGQQKSVKLGIYLYFYHEKSVESGYFCAAMLKCGEITEQCCCRWALPAETGVSFLFQRVAVRWCSATATRMLLETFEGLGAGVWRLLPDVCLVCVPVLFRYFSDTGDSDRCWWPHVWQQRPAGLQYPARTAILCCGTSNRWFTQQEMTVALHRDTFKWCFINHCHFTMYSC